jgi:hypothetical protein
MFTLAKTSVTAFLTRRCNEMMLQVFGMPIIGGQTADRKPQKWKRQARRTENIFLFFRSPKG